MYVFIHTFLQNWMFVNWQSPWISGVSCRPNRIYDTKMYWVLFAVTMSGICYKLTSRYHHFSKCRGSLIPTNNSKGKYWALYDWLHNLTAFKRRGRCFFNLLQFVIIKLELIAHAHYAVPCVHGLICTSPTVRSVGTFVYLTSRLIDITTTRLFLWGNDIYSERMNKNIQLRLVGE